MFYAIRSIPLSQETHDAWTANDVRFLRRTRTDTDIARIVERNRGEAVFNLGNTALDLNLHVPVFNMPDTVRAISLPTALRRTLNEFIPEASRAGPHWHKLGGYGGRGVVNCNGGVECDRHVGDVQQHVPGDEYRVYSVGDSIVQAYVKENGEWRGGKHYFDFRWVGVDGIRRSGIIPLIKQAVPNIPGWATSILGWDIIVPGRRRDPKVIEINTCPGWKILRWSNN